MTSPLIPGTGEATSSGFDGLALGGARILFLAGAIGSLAAVRLIAGLLLALGPFFIAFLLFDGTRGLFEGWLRVLAGAALGALGSAILLGVELALLEPWLIQLLAIRAADQPITGVPVELFAVTLVFALALLAVLVAAGRVAFGFRLPPAWRSAPVQLAQALRGEAPAAAAARAIPAAAGGRSRAVAVADAVAATQRREERTDPRRRRRLGRGTEPGRHARGPPRRAGAAGAGAARPELPGAPRPVIECRAAPIAGIVAMNKQAREALDAYYVEAESWGNDQREALAASRRTAWIVASAAGAIALMEALALVMLVPLKTVEPYTLLVDRNTGYVQALSPLDPARLSGDTALTQSFLVQYVIAREGYDVDTLQGNYRKVALWSAEQARASYVSAMQISNPQSPLAPLSPLDRGRDAGEERVAGGPQRRFGALRHPAPRSERPDRAVAILGGGDPLSLFGRADEPRGPADQSAWLPGAALSPRRRGVAGRARSDGAGGDSTSQGARARRARPAGARAGAAAGAAGARAVRLGLLAIALAAAAPAIAQVQPQPVAGDPRIQTVRI